METRLAPSLGLGQVGQGWGGMGREGPSSDVAGSRLEDPSSS